SRFREYRLKRVSAISGFGTTCLVVRSTRVFSLKVSIIAVLRQGVEMLYGSWNFELSRLSTLVKESSRVVGLFWLLKIDIWCYSGFLLSRSINEEEEYQLMEELPATTIVAYDNVIWKKAYSTLILCLGKNQSEHIDEFHKLVGDLAVIDTTISDEDQTLLLLTSLPSSYDNFMDTLLYGRDTLKLEDKDMEQGTYSAWSKSQRRSSRIGCYICQSEEHLKRDCPKYNHKKSQGYVRIEDHVSGSRADGYNSNKVYYADKLICRVTCSGIEIKCTLWGNYAQQFNDFLNSYDDNGRIVLVLQFAMMKFWDGCLLINHLSNRKTLPRKYLLLPKTLQRIFVNKHPIRNIVELLDMEQDETGTTSLSLFNDEVQAMVGRSAYQLCENYAKDNKATSNTVPAITSLDLESQTDKNTTPNEKQKTNKRPAEGEPGSESSTGKKKSVEIKVEKMLEHTTMDENDPSNARKRKKELMSNRKGTSSKVKRSNPSVSSDAFLTGRVSQMQQQDTNVVTTLLPFGLNRSLTLGNSIVSQRPVLSNTTTNANRTQRFPNSTKSVATQVLQTPAFYNTITSPISSQTTPNSPDSVATRGQQVTPVASTRKRQSPLNDVSKGAQKTTSTFVTPTIRPFSTQTSTYEVGESSRRTKRSKRPALQNRTPIRFNLDEDGNVTKVYDKYYVISEEYYHHGDPTFECKECHSLLWEAEAKRGNPNPVNKAYSICCKKRKVMLEKPPATPKPLLDLFLNDDGKS
nr:zinc finger, CCHC-type [Tanacetum cinerariifolium]